MRRLILAMALCAVLAACDKAAEESDEPLAADSASPSPTGSSWAGNYEITMPDGSRASTMLMEDGSYMDMDASGKQTQAGMWNELPDGKVCFDPEGDEGPSCYTPGKVASDGTFVVIPDEGEPLTIKKVG